MKHSSPEISLRVREFQRVYRGYVGRRVARECYMNKCASIIQKKYKANRFLHRILYPMIHELIEAKATVINTFARRFLAKMRKKRIYAERVDGHVRRIQRVYRIRRASKILRISLRKKQLAACIRIQSYFRMGCRKIRFLKKKEKTLKIKNMIEEIGTIYYQRTLKLGFLLRLKSGTFSPKEIAFEIYSILVISHDVPLVEILLQWGMDTYSGDQQSLLDCAPLHIARIILAIIKEDIETFCNMITYLKKCVKSDSILEHIAQAEDIARYQIYSFAKYPLRSSRPSLLFVIDFLSSCFETKSEEIRLGMVIDQVVGQRECQLNTDLVVEKRVRYVNVFGRSNNHRIRLEVVVRELLWKNEDRLFIVSGKLETGEVLPFAIQQQEEIQKCIVEFDRLNNDPFKVGKPNEGKGFLPICFHRS